MAKIPEYVIYGKGINVVVEQMNGKKVAVLPDNYECERVAVYKLRKLDWSKW